MSNKIRASFLIDKETWEKFKQIAAYESRSNSREAARAVKFFVENFEKENGEIKTETQKNDAK